MAIEAIDLEFGYNEDIFISGCSFTIEQGKIYAILGPNGSGKTTILKLLNGTLKPRRGKVLIDGYNVQQLGRKALARLMANVPQEHNGVFPYTVLDMVVMGRNPYLKIFGRPKAEDYLIAEEALDMLGIGHLRDKCYMEISGGERQMVFLARAIAQEASYFIMDEPTSHLDFYNQHKIMEILRGIVEEKGCCAIVSMHDPNLAMRFADEVLMIKEGRMLKEGETLEVMTSSNLSKLYNMDIKIADFEGKRNIVYV